MIGAIRRFLLLASVAGRNVRHGGRRTFSALVGMSLSLTLVLLQLGFLGAVRLTAVNLMEQFDFDAVLISPTYDSIYDSGAVPLDRIVQAASDPNVKQGRPIWMTFALWRCPPAPQRFPGRDDATQPAESSRNLWGSLVAWYTERPEYPRRELLAIGVDPFHHPFRDGPVAGAIDAARDSLALDARVLLNSLSHPDFGWDAQDEFHDWEMDDTHVEVIGGFAVPKGFGADGSVIVSKNTFLRHTRWPLRDSASLGLLRFERSDPESAERTIDAIREWLPADVQILSRAEMLTRESDHWVRLTATGLMFTAGVILAMIVAGVVVYQVLSNDVRNRLPEYATMKAIGYSNDAPVAIVVMQAAMLAILSYLPAVLGAKGLYRLTTYLAKFPMTLTIQNLAITLILALVVGVGVSLLTVRKLRAANPADLF